MKRKMKKIGVTLVLFILSIYFLTLPVVAYLDGAQIHDRDRLQWVIDWTPYIVITLGGAIIAIIIFKKIQSRKK